MSDVYELEILELDEKAEELFAQFLKARGRWNRGFRSSTPDPRLRWAVENMEADLLDYLESTSRGLLRTVLFSAEDHRELQGTALFIRYEAPNTLGPRRVDGFLRYVALASQESGLAAKMNPAELTAFVESLQGRRFGLRVRRAGGERAA